MQSNLKTSVARVNPDTAQQPAGKKKNPNLAYLTPIIFCPTGSAAKTVGQISPGSAELSVPAFTQLSGLSHSAGAL